VCRNTYPCVILLICVGVSTLVYPQEFLWQDCLICSRSLYLVEWIRYEWKWLRWW